MKVILSVDALQPTLTGVGRYALELARRLKTDSRVEDVRYWHLHQWIDDVDGLLVDGGRGRNRKWKPSRLVKNDYTVSLHRRWCSYRAAREINRTPDWIFHSPNFTLPAFSGKCVVTIHDLSAFRYPDFHPCDRVELMHREVPVALHRAEHIIAVSEFTRREIADYFGVADARITAIPNGVGSTFRPRAVEDVAPMLGKHGLVHGTYVLFVGTIEPRKNVLQLLRAYSSLEPSTRAKLPLVLAGAQGWNSEEVHDAIRIAEGEGWARYLGYLPDEEVSALLSGALCFVYPSLYEGFGLPVLEAMASGIPVVTSIGSAMAEVANGAALLIDPNDVRSITEGMRAAIEDSSWRALAASRGVEVARAYTWKNTVKRTVDLYDS